MLFDTNTDVPRSTVTCWGKAAHFMAHLLYLSINKAQCGEEEDGSVQPSLAYFQSY